METRRKRLIPVLALLLTLILVTVPAGCAGTVTAGEDEICIAVDLSEIQDVVYRVDLTYSLAGDLMGGLACSRADQRPLKGDVVFRLTETEFPQGSSREDFTFYVTLCPDTEGITDVFSASEGLESTGQCEPFVPEYGNVYRYSLEGNFEDGFVLTDLNG